LTNDDLQLLLANDSYHKYSVSASRGPDSIAKEDWLRMVREKGDSY
jgi:hypothetical protein